MVYTADDEGAKEGGECVVICVAGGSYSISPTLTLLFVFSWSARIFGCCKPFKSLSALSIYKVHRTLSFLFSCVSFFSSIYPSTNSSTLLFFSPLSLPYPIPSSSDFFSFFFFSSLPSLFRPSSTPPFPFLHGRHTDRFCNSVSSLRF